MLGKIFSFPKMSTEVCVSLWPIRRRRRAVAATFAASSSGHPWEGAGLSPMDLVQQVPLLPASGLHHSKGPLSGAGR